MLTCLAYCCVTSNIDLVMLWSSIFTLYVVLVTLPLLIVVHYAWCAMQSVWVLVASLLTRYVTVVPHTQHLGQSIDTVMHRGRWRSEASTRTYLQAGRAQLLQRVIPAAVLANADRVSRDWYSDLCKWLSNSL